MTIHAPVTVNPNGGTSEANASLAKQIASEIENTMRGVVADELRRQGSPGNLLGNRAR